MDDLPRIIVGGIPSAAPVPSVEPVPTDSDAWAEADGAVLHVGPEGLDDPETTWGPDEEMVAPPLQPGMFLLLAPGDELHQVEELPPPRRLRVGVAVGIGEMELCDGERRVVCRTALGSAYGSEAPLVTRLVVVFVNRRVRRPHRPLRYLVAIGVDGEMLAWLDYSSTWELDIRALRAMAQLVGVTVEIERFETEPEFEEAHADWVG